MCPNSPHSPDEQLLTYQELAARWRVHESTCRRRVKEAKIPKIVLGHQIVRFHWPTVLEHLKKIGAFS